jgi:hypothetical protein
VFINISSLIFLELDDSPNAHVTTSALNVAATRIWLQQEPFACTAYVRENLRDE